MGDSKNKMSINILGVDYQIVVDEDPEKIKQLVASVDQMIKQTKKSSPSMTNMSAAVLCALNLADELEQCKEKIEDADEKESQFDELNAYKERFQLATETISKLDSNIKVLQSRNERLELDNREVNELLDEYKSKFTNLRTEYELCKRNLTDSQNKLMDTQMELVKARKKLLEYGEN